MMKEKYITIPDFSHIDVIFPVGVNIKKQTIEKWIEFPDKQYNFKFNEGGHIFTYLNIDDIENIKSVIGCKIGDIICEVFDEDNKKIYCTIYRQPIICDVTKEKNCYVMSIYYKRKETNL